MNSIDNSELTINEDTYSARNQRLILVENACMMVIKLDECSWLMALEQLEEFNAIGNCA